MGKQKINLLDTNYQNSLKQESYRSLHIVSEDISLYKEELIQLIKYFDLHIYEHIPIDALNKRNGFVALRNTNQYEYVKDEISLLKSLGYLCNIIYIIDSAQNLREIKQIISTIKDENLFLKTLDNSIHNIIDFQNLFSSDSVNLILNYNPIKDNKIALSDLNTDIINNKLAICFNQSLKK